MSDIHIYLEREQPVKVITLEPTGARGPVGLQGPAGPNSVTSATTSDGTCDLWIDTLRVGTGTASGTYSAAFGSGTTASGLYSFSGGLGSTASGDISFAFGGATASGTAAFAFGDGAMASGDASYAFGTDANAVHQGASVETDSQTGTVTSSTTTDEKTFRFANGYRFLGGSAYFEGTVLANHIHGNLAGSVYAHVRAGEALLKGDPVYISGSHGTAPNLIPIVSKADASNSAKMPAIGIMDADLANNANGHMVITGTIADLNTAAYAVNDTLYVASGGGFTATPPAANSQPVARVERSNANNGALIVKVNGLASNGGNGVSDANKLVRFNSTGGISQTGGTMTDTTYAGTASFTSTTRPTSAGTGAPAATSLMTRNDVDARGGYAISQTVAVNESGDQNTITFKTSTNLAMTLEAGTWDFECLIIVDCNNTTAGSKQRMNFSGTQTTFAGVLYTVFDGSTTSTRFPTAKSTSLVDSEFSVGAASTATLRIGRIVVTASGVLSAQFAQRTATVGTSPTLVAGSYLRARKIS